MNIWAREIVFLTASTALLVGCSTTGPGGMGKSSSGSPMSWAQVIDRNPDPSVITNPQMLAKIKATGLPWRVRDTASGIEMLLVPPGDFVMGMSPGDALAMEDERPAHMVTISKPFYLGRTEVTQGQWTEVMGSNQSYFQEAYYRIESADETDAKIAEFMRSGYTLEEAKSKAGDGKLVETFSGTWPLETITPDEIAPYLMKTGLRLPTEAEWEYACRAGVREPLYGPLDDIAWYSGNSQEKSHPVGGKKANSLGFYDMIGNVWEWCSDWYSSDYYSTCENGVTDPTGPSVNEFRVARGGSWDHVSKNCRASFRENHFMPDPRITDFGFRVARNP
jgi:formylglycine-generating enzyme required for sulfatase activity